MVDATGSEGIRCFDLNMMAAPAMKLTADASIIYVNDHYVVTFGNEGRVPHGRSIFDFVPTPSHSRIRHAIDALTRERPSAALDFPITDDANRNCWTRWTFKGRFEESGALAEVLAVGRVITEELRYRNALEDLLRISNNPSKSYEERARMILAVGIKYFDADLAGITRLDGDMAVPVMLNFEKEHIRENRPIPRASSYVDLVLRAGPVVSIHDMMKTDFADYPFFTNLPLKSVIASEIYTANRFYGIINFGTLTPRAEPFSEKQTQFCRLIAQWLGYTLEQQEFYVGLERNASNYRRVYEHAPIMMAVLDFDRTLLDVNKKWLTTLGYEEHEVLGRKITDFYTPQSCAKTPTGPIPDSPLTVQTHVRDFTSKDGRVLSTQAASMVVAAEDLPVLTVWSDASERNQLRDEMQATNRALIQANEELKRFNTVAAHDLQEPLRKIRLFGDQLAKRLPDDASEESRHALEIVTRSADRLSRLVRDLLAFSRESERGYARDPIALKPLIEEVVNDLALLIEENRAEVIIGDLPPVLGDAVPVQRLFHNLIINAVKYRRPDEPPRIEVFARTRDDGAHEIVVRDNGVGLPEGYEEQIFEPFIRLHSVRTAGSGIGLALVRSIAEGHGWSIRAERRPDVGTDFVITTTPVGTGAK